MNPSEERFDEELEKVGQTADEIWEHYSSKYQPEGLELAELAHDRGVPACLYSAKGAPLFPSSALGKEILRVMRHTNFLVKTREPWVGEQQQLVRLIREQKVLRRRAGRVLSTAAAFVATALASGFAGHNWSKIGDFVRRATNFIFD